MEENINLIFVGWVERSETQHSREDSKRMIKKYNPFLSAFNLKNLQKLRGSFNHILPLPFFRPIDNL